MYYHHQNDSSYNQNDAYRRHRRRRQNPSYYDQNYAYRHRNPSYYDQNYPYRHLRRHHQNQHHHQNPSYDQIPHHHHHHHHHHHQIEAPTRLLLVAKVKAKAPVVVDFPVDVLIPILARLPAKTLLKFRCVCKSWNSLIQQDHHFISLHLNNNNNNNKKLSPLVTFRREGFYGFLNYSSSSSDSTHYEIDFSQSLEQPQFITNSCNGLLGLYNSCSFLIVNPTIRKLRPLPRPTHSCYSSSEAGLGFDSSTGVYKVVRIFDLRCEEGTELARFGCEVYYLGGGSGGGWKQIDGPPVQPSFLSLPVVVDGAILWASETVLEVVALCFDLREEKFSVIMHPEGSSSRSSTLFFRSHVFASGGRICVAEMKTSEHTNIMNIWLLIKDDNMNNSNKWVKQYVIDLTFLFVQMCPLGCSQPLTTDHNGRIVISWGYGRKDYYDPRTGSFEKHELDAIHADVEHAAPYTESMVWPWPTHCGVQ